MFKYQASSKFIRDKVAFLQESVPKPVSSGVQKPGESSSIALRKKLEAQRSQLKNEVQTNSKSIREEQIPSQYQVVDQTPESGIQPNIEAVSSTEQLNQTIKAQIQSLNKSLEATDNNVRAKVFEQVQQQIANLQSGGIEEQKITEAITEEKKKNKEKGLGFLKGLKDKASGLWSKLLPKLPLTPNQVKVLGLATTAAGLGLLAVYGSPLLAIHLTGSTMAAGTLGSYTLGGLGTGFLGTSAASLAAVPYASAFATGVGAATTTVGGIVAAFKNKIALKNPENSSPASVSVEEPVAQPTTMSQAVANTPSPVEPNTPPRVVVPTQERYQAQSNLSIGREKLKPKNLEKSINIPLGFESNDVLESLNINILPVGAKIALNVTVDGKNAKTNATVVKGVDGQNILKLPIAENAFVKISSTNADNKVETGVVSKGQDFVLTYEDGQKWQITLNSFEIQEKAKPVSGEASVAINTDTPEFKEINNLDKVEKSLFEYKSSQGDIKNQVEAINKSIKILNDSGLDTKDLKEKQKNLELKTQPLRGQVIKDIVPIASDLNKAISIKAEDRTEVQKQQAKLYNDLQQEGFIVGGGTKQNDAAMISESPAIIEKKVVEPESKEVTESSVEQKESGTPNVKQTIQNFELLKNTFENENEALSKMVDDTIESLDELAKQQDPKTSTNEILGLPETDGIAKREDLVRASLLFGDIAESKVQDPELKFLTQTSQSFEEGVKSNPSTKILIGYRGAGYDNLHRLVENLSQAKLFMKIKDTNDKITELNKNKELGKDIGRDQLLEISLDILSGDPVDISSDIIQMLVEKKPSLVSFLTKQNLEDLYNNKSNLYSYERDELLKLPEYISKLLQNESFDEIPDPDQSPTKNTEKSKVTNLEEFKKKKEIKEPIQAA
ncbi:MAG: hypothetical protein AAGF07_00185 [Patescibacteria group bacterium]